MYKRVLNIDIGDIGDVIRAKKPSRLPVVLSAEEMADLLVQLEGTRKLMGELLYGTGMRIIELVRLRVKDIDFNRHMIFVRGGKGQKDRTVPLPSELTPELKVHIEKARRLHDQDLAAGYGTVHLPFALDRKYPNAPKEWAWKIQNDRRLAAQTPIPEIVAVQSPAPAPLPPADAQPVTTQRRPESPLTFLKRIGIAALWVIACLVGKRPS